MSLIKVKSTSIDGALGITVAEMWRLTSNKTSSGDITANLVRESQSGYGSINHGMTESSGIFTFPSTGIYYIAVDQTFHVTSGGNDRRCEIHIQTTTNNSSYSIVARASAGIHDTSGSNVCENASEVSFFPTSILLAISISPTLERSSTFPISFRYILTGSSVRPVSSSFSETTIPVSLSSEEFSSLSSS